MRRVLITTVMSLALFAFVAGSAVAEPSKEPFEIKPGSFHIVPSTTEAAAHENLTTEFDFAHNGKNETDNDVRNIVVNLPPGFIGNNNAVPTCTSAELVDRSPFGGGDGQLPACPVDTAVGQISFDAGGEHTNRVTVPIFNIETTTPGIVAELGFHALDTTVVLPVTVRPGDSGLTVTTPNVESLLEARDISFTVWGVPAAAEHDAERQYVCEEEACTDAGGPYAAGIPARPYLANSTSCGPHTASMEADSWEHPNEWSKAETVIGPVVECERVPFAPSIVVRPTTNTTESPSGLNISLVVPQSWENIDSVASSNLRGHDADAARGVHRQPVRGVGPGRLHPRTV